MSANTNRAKMMPRVAWNAIRNLLANPEDTAQVFTIIRAMSGPSLERGYRRFRLLPTGRKVLEQEIDLLDTLKDRETLRALPPGSLGRAYLAFVEGEGLSADGLVEASEGEEENWHNPEIERYGKRLRDMHDLWHTLTCYGRDELGELCLLAFTYAQTKNRGIGLIVLVAAQKFSRTLGRQVFRAVRRGYADGRRAAWLPGQDWEAQLARPIDDVRRDLGIAAPVAYQALRCELAAAA